MYERNQPEPISTADHQARIRRITRIGRALGFVGRMEYRHAYSQSGGAQYCIGPSVDDDILIVYAEAFERDANPDDFGLEAIIAHECGHQCLTRNSDLRTVLARFRDERFEEILASLVGSILLGESDEAQTLVWKATAELGQLGISSVNVVRFIERMRRLLREFT